MWFLYIRVAVAVAPAASVILCSQRRLKKSHLHLHRLDGFLKNNNNLTKKKILKMWLAGGESNPCVKNIYGLNANMCFDFLDCPIAAAATESPSCQCV